MDAAANPRQRGRGGGFVPSASVRRDRRQANFCTMGAVSDVVNIHHWGACACGCWPSRWPSSAPPRSRAGRAGGHRQGIYQRSTLNWLSLVVGGALFGVGMSLAGGCASKNLIRLGGGSLRSLVVLCFLAISARTLRGLFGQWRATWLDPVAIGDWRASAGRPGPAHAAGLGGHRNRKRRAGSRRARWRCCCSASSPTGAPRQPRAMAGRPRARRAGGGGWYVSGHLGFGENPETLGDRLLRHQHAHAGIAQLRRAAGLRAGC